MVSLCINSSALSVNIQETMEIPMGFPHGRRKDRILAGGWPTPLKNDGVRQFGIDDIPNIWKNKKRSQTTKQN